MAMMAVDKPERVMKARVTEVPGETKLAVAD